MRNLHSPNHPWYSNDEALDLLFRQEYEALQEMGVDPDDVEHDWFGYPA